MNVKKIVEIMKKYSMVIALVLVTLFFTWQTGGRILYPQNISNLISQNAYVFILATGMLLCILTGGNIDLSVGSILCFTGAVGATLMENKNVSVIVAIAVMLIMGTLIGAWQGFWIAYVKVPPFIVTLAGMLIFRGLSNVVLEGLTISLSSAGFLRVFGGGADCYVSDFFNGEVFNYTCMLLGVVICIIILLMEFKNRVNKKKNGYEVEALTPVIVKNVIICVVILAFFYKLSLFKGIPSALLWVMLVVIVYGYITSNTTIGRHFYAVGGNEKATELSGINTKKVYFLAYMNMGLLSALAGLLTIARSSSANPTIGNSYEMDAIASCFIGGASAYGGSGTVVGVIIGAVLMGVINLGMSIMGVDTNYQKVVKGLVLLGAVIFDVLSKRKAQKS